MDLGNIIEYLINILIVRAVEDRGKTRLQTSSTCLQTLQQLSLYTNKIGDAGAQYLAEALKTNQVSIRTRNIDSNRFYFFQTNIIKYFP